MSNLKIALKVLLQAKIKQEEIKQRYLKHNFLSRHFLLLLLDVGWAWAILYSKMIRIQLLKRLSNFNILSRIDAHVSKSLTPVKLWKVKRIFLKRNLLFILLPSSMLYCVHPKYLSCTHIISLYIQKLHFYIYNSFCIFHY